MRRPDLERWVATAGVNRRGTGLNWPEPPFFSMEMTLIFFSWPSGLLQVLSAMSV